VRLFKDLAKWPAQNKMPKLDRIYLDGFFELTPSQLELLKMLCPMAANVTVTLTADAHPEKNRFTITDKFRSELRKMGFDEASGLFEGNRRSDHEDLRFLEENLFWDPPSAITPPSIEHIEIIEARSERDEIEIIAREIRKIYATGKYHFSDFCLIYRQIGSYAAHGALLESAWFRRWAEIENEFRETTQIEGHVEVVRRLLMKYIFRVSGIDGEADMPGVTRAHALRRFSDVLNELAYSFKRRGDQEVLFEEFFTLLKRTVDVSLFSDPSTPNRG
jgi:hypothetical protein